MKESCFHESEVIFGNKFSPLVMLLSGLFYWSHGLARARLEAELNTFLQHEYLLFKSIHSEKDDYFINYSPVKMF